MVNEALARSVVSLVQSLHRATHLLTAIDPSNVAQWEGVEEADWDQLEPRRGHPDLQTCAKSSPWINSKSCRQKELIQIKLPYSSGRKWDSPRLKLRW